jgi:hypothetical protein
MKEMDFDENRCCQPTKSWENLKNQKRACNSIGLVNGKNRWFEKTTLVADKSASKSTLSISKFDNPNIRYLEIFLLIKYFSVIFNYIFVLIVVNQML